MKRVWMDTAAWAGTVIAALAFAVAAPKGLAVLGRLPPVAASNLNREPVMVPEGLKADRTLLLLNFKGGQGKDIETWITGLHLRDDTSTAWLRMPVLDESGAARRSQVEGRLLSHHVAPTERANVVPVFTDQAAFLQSAGLTRTDVVYVVVVNRQGEVLARAEGPYDIAKAKVLHDTLVADQRI